jgi:hypothetical protein
MCFSILLLFGLLYGYQEEIKLPLVGRKDQVKIPVYKSEEYLLAARDDLGVLTSYPVNRWLIKQGIKEAKGREGFLSAIPRRRG